MIPCCHGNTYHKLLFRMGRGRGLFFGYSPPPKGVLFCLEDNLEVINLYEDVSSSVEPRKSQWFSCKKS